MPEELSIREICSLDDELLLPWLGLYESCFPPEERLQVSEILELVKSKSQGKARGHVLLAAVDGDGQLAGMAYYKICHDAYFAVLWYLATASQIRNKGLGGKLYDYIVECIRQEGMKALLLEVEIPERTHASQRYLAERRIAFYARHGARLLSGIHYMQYVGAHQPLTPMYILVQPVEEVGAEEAFRMVRRFAGDAVTQTGELKYEGANQA